MDVQGITVGTAPKFVYAYQRVRRHRPVCLAPKTRDYVAGNHLPPRVVWCTFHTPVWRDDAQCYVSVGGFCDHEHGSPTAA